jgi:2-polyprenyl-3-methyl-5-hydroxy-6-metoxy-1,4-benzoquinol methylase
MPSMTWDQIDSGIRKLAELGYIPYDQDRYRVGAFNAFPVLLESGIDFSKMTALEIGCGRGLKAVSFSKLFRNYVGVDLNAALIKDAEILKREFLASEFHPICANAMDVLADPKKFGLDGHPDFLVLYAVLEHTLPEERSSLIRLARTVVECGGAVLIAETPNRLIPYDAHTTGRHFLQSLPMDMARRYDQKKWPTSEAFSRAGAALSYHDFELDFLDGKHTGDLPFISTGWDANWIRNQPISPSEVWLNDYVTTANLKVSPAFTRFWIEGLLCSQPGIRRQVSTKPGSIITGEVRPAQVWWSNPTVLPKFFSGIRFGVGTGTSDREMILQFPEGANGTSVIRFDTGESHEIDIDKTRSEMRKPWHSATISRCTVPLGASKVQIKAKSGELAISACIVNEFGLS